MIILTVLNSIALFFVFSSLCVVCDDFLVPAVEFIIIKYQVPEEIAAVTLIALGSSSPELFLNSVSAITHTSDLSISAVLGSGMIAFGLIPSLCVLCSTPKVIKLKVFPVLRECGFYLLGLLMFLLAIKDGKMGKLDTLAIVSVYFFYLGLVIILTYSEEPIPENEKLENIIYTSVPTLDPEEIQLKLMNSDFIERDLSSDDSLTDLIENGTMHFRTLSNTSPKETFPSRQDEPTINVLINPPNSISHHIYYIMEKMFDFFSYPAKRVLPLIMPVLVKPGEIYKSHLTLTESEPSQNCHIKVQTFCYNPLGLRGNSLKTQNPLENREKGSFSLFWRLFVVFSLSFLCIGFLTSAVVNLCGNLVKSLGVDTSSLGASVVALGSEVPDVVSAVAMARSGYHDGAIAGAIGSQVINLSLGVGIPALLTCFSEDGPMSVQHRQADSLWLLASFLLVIIGSYVLMVVPCYGLIRGTTVCPSVNVPCSSSKEFKEKNVLTAEIKEFSSYCQIVLWLSIHSLFLYFNNY